MDFRLVPNSETLNDLERPKFVIYVISPNSVYRVERLFALNRIIDALGV